MLEDDLDPMLRQLLGNRPAALGLGAAMILANAGAPDGAAAATHIQEVVSPGGIEAWLVEEHSLPIIAVDISFIGGASLEPAEKSGLAALLANMLEEGAGPYDSAAFAEKKDEIAARIGFDAGRDTIAAKLTMLRDKRAESLELFRLALTEPRFDAEALEKVKGQTRSILRQQSADPNQLASQRFFATLFPDDPYGRPRLGSEETVSAITDADLRAAIPRLLNKARMKIGVVGAVSAAELGPMLDQLLGGLSDQPVERPGPVTPAERPSVSIVDFDAPQSTVVFGQEGIARKDPDFLPAYVMNYVLGGGGFASRLTEEVREKRGLTYGVYSYLAPLDRAALYLGGVATANERVAEAVAVIRDEWRKMAEEGVSEDELEKAKAYLTGAYPLRFDSNSKIASFLVSAQLDDLGVDYIDRRNDMVKAVTREDVQRVAKRILQEDRLFFAVAGRPEGLETAKAAE